MPTVITPVITDAGLNAAITANGNGVQLSITHVVLSTDQFTPTGTSTISVRKEKATVASGYTTGAGAFRINVLFSSYSGALYNATTIGFYAGDPDAGGILFAVYSHPTSIIVQRNSLDYLAQYGLTLSRVPAGSISVTVDPTAAQAFALIAAHETAVDPHAGYLLKTGGAATGAILVPTPTAGVWNTQVANMAAVQAAINYLFSGTNQNLVTDNAYQKLPGGLIIQMGYSLIPTGNGDIVSFPIAFPNEVLALFSVDRGSGCNVTAIARNGTSKTTCLAFGKIPSNGVYSSTGFGFLAIGR
jgi:hypothetical protein